MGYQRGKPLEPAMKRAIVKLKGYFDRNRLELGFLESSAQLTADALEINVSTVKSLMAEYRKRPDCIEENSSPRGRPKLSVSASHFEAVRTYIRETNQKGSHLTLQSVCDFLREVDPTGSYNTSTLSRTLDRWGFTFGQGTRCVGLKEKDYVITARRKYLRRMRENRNAVGELSRPEVYLDESYVNKNHSRDLTWYHGEDGAIINKPTGKGERLIIINAITSEGWVPNAKLVFKSTRKTGDYHGQVNGPLFRKWFKEMLLPNIPESSLIIMDNASYHNELAPHSPPTLFCSKERIYTWLHQEGYPCSDGSLKAELVNMLKKAAPTTIYEADILAIAMGHEIVRTPPYHPELQPIKMCWALVKGYIARNCDFTMQNLYKGLEHGFDEITPNRCQKIIAKIRKVEGRYWTEDSQFDPSDS